MSYIQCVLLQDTAKNFNECHYLINLFKHCMGVRHLEIPFGCRFPVSAAIFGPANLSCTLFGLPVMDSSSAASSSAVWLMSSSAGLLLSASSAVSSSCLIISSVKTTTKSKWEAYLYNDTSPYRFYGSSQKPWTQSGWAMECMAWKTNICLCKG